MKFIITLLLTLRLKKNTVFDRRIQEKILKEKQKIKVDRLVFSLNKIV